MGTSESELGGPLPTSFPSQLLFVATSLAVGTLAHAQTAPTPPASDRVEELVIIATRTEQPSLLVPAAVSTQDFSELRQEGFLYGTDEFRGVPGVYFRRGEGDGEEFPFLTIRGITGNHGNDTFLALIDGIPFVGADEEVLLFEVPYTAVERMEVVRGPVSALYGRGAIAGAVNYRTRTPDENAIHLSASVGNHDYYAGDVVLERQFGEHAALASLSYESDGGWREHSARHKANLFAKGDFRGARAAGAPAACVASARRRSRFETARSRASTRSRTSLPRAQTP